MKLQISRGFLAVMILAAAGCGGGDDGDGPTPEAPDAAAVMIDAAPPDAPASTRIEATVSYAGTAEGTLIVAAFTSMPPAGPPVGFAQQSSPVFPATLAIEDLDPGTLYVLALLDVPPASPQQPGPEDLQAWSDATTIVEDQTAAVALTLVDP